MWNIKPLAHTFQKLLAKLKIFQKVGQTPRSRKQGKKWGYTWLGHGTTNIHVKYQSSRTYSSKVITTVKVSKKVGQFPRSRSQGLCTHGNFLSHRILKWNIKALALNVQKLLARLKFLKGRSKSKIKVTGSKVINIQ